MRGCWLNKLHRGRDSRAAGAVLVLLLRLSRVSSRMELSTPLTQQLVVELQALQAEGVFSMCLQLLLLHKQGYQQHLRQQQQTSEWMPILAGWSLCCPQDLLQHTSHLALQEVEFQQQLPRWQQLQPQQQQQQVVAAAMEAMAPAHRLVLR